MQHEWVDGNSYTILVEKPQEKIIIGLK